MFRNIKNIKRFSDYKEISLPNLIEIQINSYKWFLEKGLRELFDEISPIVNYPRNDLILTLEDYYLDEPLRDEKTAKEKGLSYEAPLRVKLKLNNKRTGEIKEQEIFFGDFPVMTSRGTFIINGVERVVISQLIRSSGIFFVLEQERGKNLFGAKIIPNRGAWLEFMTDYDNSINVRIDRKRKINAFTLLRIFGLETDEMIKKEFSDLSNEQLKYIETTLKKDPSHSKDEAFVEIYKKLRPGELASIDNARQLIEGMFFNFARYDLSRVGRYRLNIRLYKMTSEKALKIELDKKSKILNLKDIVLTIKEIVRLNVTKNAKPDDIDHLGNRRVRVVGELLQNKVRIGLARMERIIRDRMSTVDVQNLMIHHLINIRPLMTVVKEFFSSSQLSQFMDQVNALAELEHKRRLSAMGPGGLARERAKIEVRDVHPSHYGRICPIQTPEGQNIGLVVYLSSWARINELGFIETAYLKVKNTRVTDEIVYLTASEEENYNIVHAGVKIDKRGYLIDKIVEARIKGEPGEIEAEKIDFMDISPQQLISVSAALIPFLEHDDANRALMGSNMQRQAVPCIKPEMPLVSTGFEKKAAQDSGQVLIAEEDGKVIEVDANHILIKTKNNKKHNYQLNNFLRSNQFTSISHRPVVLKNQKIKKGDVLADGSSTHEGNLALGQNLLVAFLPFRGGNFEDAIVISERLIKEDYFSSIHIEDFTCDVRDTKLGPEIITSDIPNVGEEQLKNLDEDGIVRIGAEVSAGDILVGKISPRGETDLTSEERLLRAIFGEKAREVKDTSLRLPHGKRGRVIGIKILSREKGDKLPAGVIQSIQVEIAQFRKIMVGDKLAGRHGNKGVISKLLPIEEMPFLEDGTPVDIVLNPLSVASRMNLGQILETHLGWAAAKLGYIAISPALKGVSEEDVGRELKRANLPEDGKVVLYDGRTGLPFSQKVTVGYIYMMKLNHLVEDKIHMRSIGPYSLITQQPLGGKAQFGGQRFGEMEVWALEGYGAAYSLQEMLTIKSDDVTGRISAYDAIIRGEQIKNPSIPSSFNVFLNELKALCLSVDLIGDKDQSKIVKRKSKKY